MSLVLKRTKDDMPGSVPGEDYVVFSGSLRLGRIHKVASGFSKPFSVVLRADCVDGRLLKNSGPSDSRSREFSSALIQTRQENHSIDGTQNCVAAITPVMSVDLSEVLIGEN